MRSVSCISKFETPLVLDASVFVNLSATGYADRILEAIPVEVLIPAPVVTELLNSIKLGYNDAIALRPLLEEGIVSPLDIPRKAQLDYLELVSGSTASSLGDGEAATIASANALNAWAAIDERKARRVCENRYQNLKVSSTVDLLTHHDVTAAFSDRELSVALIAALEIAHMHVPDEHLCWVAQHIGLDRVEALSTLPRAFCERYRRISVDAKSRATTTGIS